MSVEHSKEFYKLSADEKLNTLYDVIARVADGQLKLHNIVDPVQGTRRVAMLAVSGFLGGAVAQIVFLTLLAVSCR